MTRCLEESRNLLYLKKMYFLYPITKHWIYICIFWKYLLSNYDYWSCFYWFGFLFPWKISLKFYLFKFFYILICVFHVHILFLLFPFKSSIFCIRCINFLFIFKIETFFSKKFLHHHLHDCIVFLPFVSQFISLTTKYI